MKKGKKITGRTLMKRKLKGVFEEQIKKEKREERRKKIKSRKKK